MLRLRWALLIMACGAGPLLADPAAVVLRGEYRPLLASNKPLLGGSFEQELGQALAAEINAPQPPALEAGAAVEGVPVYDSMIGGLTASDGGLRNWAALRGQTFCASQGYPHIQTVASLFGATPRLYPSAAHALNGIKLGECALVVEDQRLLQDIVGLPEWRRYDRLLKPLDDARTQLRVAAAAADKQPAVAQAVDQLRRSGALEALTQKWVHEVAFQAYVLADTLDCH